MQNCTGFRTVLTREQSFFSGFCVMFESLIAHLSDVAGNYLARQAGDTSDTKPVIEINRDIGHHVLDPVDRSVFTPPAFDTTA